MLGVQKPSRRAGPKPLDISAFDDALILLQACQLDLDPWQRTVLRQMLGMDRVGKYISSQMGFSVPRQNGKSALIEARVLAGLFVMGEELILVAAHELSTTDELFLRIKGLIEAQPSLESQVRLFRSGNGKHAIELWNGQRVRFIARTKNSGRGLATDALILDEAQEISDLAYAALRPTTSARPNPQIVLTGTVPGPDSQGDVFRRMRDSALKGTDPRVSWLEWSAADDASMDDPSAWAQANPALGYRLTEATIKDDQTLGEELFFQERLGVWREEVAGAKALDYRLWQKLGIPSSTAPTDGVKAFGVKFSLDGSEVALAVARRPDDGPVHVEGIQSAPLGKGTGWLVEFLKERESETAQIVIDGKSGSGMLVDALRDAGVKNKNLIIVPSTDNVVTAHSMFKQAVDEGSVSHIAQEELDVQVSAALRRKIGNSGGYGWTTPAGSRVTLFEAATFAFWAAKTTTRRPSKRGGVLIL